MGLRNDTKQILLTADFICEILIFFGALYFTVHFGISYGIISFRILFVFLDILILAHIALFFSGYNIALIIGLAAKGATIICSALLLLLYLLKHIGLFFISAWTSAASGSSAGDFSILKNSGVIFLLFVCILSQVFFIICQIHLRDKGRQINEIVIA